MDNIEFLTRGNTAENHCESSGHRYIKAINYQVEDGVECAKCGQLWVAPKADLTQRVLNWIDREIARMKGKQPFMVALQTLQDLRTEITNARA